MDRRGVGGDQVRGRVDPAAAAESSSDARLRTASSVAMRCSTSGRHALIAAIRSGQVPAVRAQGSDPGDCTHTAAACGATAPSPLRKGAAGLLSRQRAGDLDHIRVWLTDCPVDVSAQPTAADSHHLPATDRVTCLRSHPRPMSVHEPAPGFRLWPLPPTRGRPDRRRRAQIAFVVATAKRLDLRQPSYDLFRSKRHARCASAAALRLRLGEQAPVRGNQAEWRRRVRR